MGLQPSDLFRQNEGKQNTNTNGKKIAPQPLDSHAMELAIERLNSSPDWIKYLTDIRQISKPILKHYNIGVSAQRTGFGEPVTRITIPILDEEETLVNIRRWLAPELRKENDSKILNVSGHGQARLYPIEQLKNDELLLVEGELDALAAISAGFNALTTTGGANSFSFGAEFANKNVTILMDNDAEGAAGASKRLAAITQSGGTARIATWPTQREDKWDITDELSAYDADSLKAIVDSAQAPPAAFELTDLGNSERFVADHAGSVLHCPQLTGDHDLAGWITWNGQYWEENALTVQELAKKSTRKIKGEQPVYNATRKVNLTYTHYVSSQSANKIRAMIRLSKSHPKLQVRADEFDADPWLFNTAKNTLNLQTGEIYEPRKKDFLRLSTPVEYDPEAECPRWDKYLYECMGENQIMVDFLQTFTGYCLTGDMREKKLVIHYGQTDSGKSVFFNTLNALLGSYAETASASAFIYHAQNVKRNDLAKVRGARFVTVSESRPGEMFDTQTIKRITGSDPIDAEEKHKNPFTYKPQFKLSMITNSLPDLDVIDFAMIKRILVVNWNVSFGTIGNPPQIKDLDKILLSELPGILNWAIKGCRRWQSEGLRIPPQITRDTQLYADEQDRLKPFLDECCEFDPIFKIPQSELWALYNRYDSSKSALGKHRFLNYLKNRPEIQIVKIKGALWLRGLGIGAHGLTSLQKNEWRNP